MTRCTRLLHHMWHLTGTLLMLLVDVIRFLRLCLRPAPVLAAENLFLRKQLAQYQERHVNLDAPPMLPASSWSGSGAGLTGARLSPWCNLPRSSAGTTKDSGCSGDGITSGPSPDSA